MRVAIRPPEYFPPVHSFVLMTQADAFVVADGFQYSRQTFQNRAQICTAQGKQWLSIPLEGGQFGNAITNMKLDRQNTDWKRQHLRALTTNYQSSAFYLYYEEAFRAFFAQDFVFLSDVTNRSIQMVHQLLGLTTPLHFANESGQLGASVSQMMQSLGGTTFVTLPNAAHFENIEGAEIEVLRLKEVVYHQNFQGFIPNLSILDLLFNYGPEALSILQEMSEQ